MTPAGRPSSVTLVAHRGFAGVAPENTVGAVREAARRADAVEVDVRRCASGELVAVHDETVDRVTGATGRVADLTAAELAALSVEGSGEGVPTLAAVVEATPPTVGLVVELKERGLTADVLSTLAGFEGEVLVQSFDAVALRAAREAAPSMPCLLLSYEEPAATLDHAVDLDCAAVGVHHDLCSPSFVAAAHDAGLDVYGWTVADRETARRLVDTGVDGVVSDYPDVLTAGDARDTHDG